jgi:hypothetical protein
MGDHMAVNAQTAPGGDADWAAWIPLFQTALWVLLLRQTIDKRLAAGGAFKIDPFEFDELKDRLNAVLSKVDDLNGRSPEHSSWRCPMRCT